MVKAFLKQPPAVVVAAAVLVSLLTSTASAATWGPSIRLTARGNELARTTGLRHGDLPSGFRGGFVAGRPGMTACGSKRPADDGLHVSGYAAAGFAGSGGQVSSNVTIYGTSAMTDRLFGRLRSDYTGACTVAGAVSGRLVSVSALRVDVPLDHARGFAFVLRRNGADWSGRVYVLGEGRIASILVVQQRGHRLSGGTAPLALSLLVSRMED